MHLATSNSKHCDLEEKGLDCSHTPRNVEATVEGRCGNPGNVSGTQSLSVLLLVAPFLTYWAPILVG